jgi:hypothetical protein
MYSLVGRLGYALNCHTQPAVFAVAAATNAHTKRRERDREREREKEGRKDRGHSSPLLLSLEMNVSSLGGVNCLSGLSQVRTNEAPCPRALTYLPRVSGQTFSPLPTTSTSGRTAAFSAVCREQCHFA